MKKTTIAIALSACALMANAEDVDFVGTAGAACGFTNVVDGTLNVIGTSATTATGATYDVTNNDPNGFKVVVPQVTTFAVAPGSATMSGNLTQTPALASGANFGVAFTGNDATGYEADLAAVGVDSFTLSVAATIANPESGSYTIRVPVTCVAQ